MKKISSKKLFYFLFYNDVGKFDSNWFISYRDTEFYKICTFDFI